VTGDTAPRPLYETHTMTHTMAIICTDRGQHKRVRLATAEWWAPNEGGAEHATYRGFGQKFAHETGARWLFQCGLCPRTPQVSEPRWDRLMAGARAGLVSSFDV